MQLAIEALSSAEPAAPDAELVKRLLEHSEQSGEYPTDYDADLMRQAAAALSGQRVEVSEEALELSRLALLPRCINTEAKIMARELLRLDAAMRAK